MARKKENVKAGLFALWSFGSTGNGQGDWQLDKRLDRIITIIFYGAIKRSTDIITQKSKRFGLNLPGLRSRYELCVTFEALFPIFALFSVLYLFDDL